MKTTPVHFDNRAARAMRSAYEAQKDGALISVKGGAKRLVFFEKGYLVGAKSELVEERLGEVILAERGVSREQLEVAARYIRSGRKLGRILVELGFLKSGEIEIYVRRQIVRIASAMLTSTSQRLLFSTKIPVDALTLRPVSIAEVFLEAAFHLTDIGLYRDKLFLDEYVLSQTPDALALAGAMKLSADDALVLDLVDDRKTVAEILAASPHSEDRTLRFLLALRQAGIVSLKQPSQPQPVVAEPVTPSRALSEWERLDPFEQELTTKFNEMQCQNHWQVLGLVRNTSFDEVEAAFQALYRKFDPSKFERLPTPDTQEKLSAVRARLKEAYVTLSSNTQTRVYNRLVEHESHYEKKREDWETIPAETVAKPESAERATSPQESRSLFLQAKRAYKEQDFYRAIELCRASIELSDGNDPERFHLLGKALSENPRWRQDAEQNLKIAHNLKPWEPSYLVSLAKFYDEFGLHHRAERLYEQLRVMDPEYEAKEKAKEKAKSETGLEGVLDEKTG
jgi:curved DNA-binding protein CbpA